MNKTWIRGLNCHTIEPQMTYDTPVLTQGQLNPITGPPKSLGLLFSVTTSSCQEWVICTAAAFLLDVVAVSQSPS